MSNTTYDSNELSLKVSEIMELKLNGLKMESENSINNLRESINNLGTKVNDSLNVGYKDSKDAMENLNSKFSIIEKANESIGLLNNNVVDLESVLSNKQARGAFGEVQLEQVVSNMYPSGTYNMQYQLSNNSRVDCAIQLPEDKVISVDSKFPLESFRRIKDKSLSKTEIDKHKKQFKIDIKKHIDTIASKYIISDETIDIAVMFIPAESVFIDINDEHYDLIEYAQKKKVVLVSPSTLPSILILSYTIVKDELLKKNFNQVKSLLEVLQTDSERFKSRYESIKMRYKQMGEDINNCDVSFSKMQTKMEKLSKYSFHN